MHEKKIKLFNIFLFPYAGLICTPAASYLMRNLLTQEYSFMEALFFGFCLVSLLILIPTLLWTVFRQKILRKVRQTERKWLLKYVDLSD